LLARNQAKIDTLVAGNEALTLQNSSSNFQLTILQLLHATRGQLVCPGASSARLSCCAESSQSSEMLLSFGKSVEKEFFGTRVPHRKSPLHMTGTCELPQYEVLNVDVVINPDLAERQRQFIQQTGGVAVHQYRAHRVASSVTRKEGMLVKRLHGGKECVDEGMLLGWHGASDDVVEKIIAKGFNPCCTGSGSGTMFGKGLYFAENSSKADLYAGSNPGRFKNPPEKMSVILAALYCGNMYEAKTSGLWTEPPTPTAAQTKETGIRRCVATCSANVKEEIESRPKRVRPSEEESENIYQVFLCWRVY
jgi:hypothetical protein